MAKHAHTIWREAIVKKKRRGIGKIKDKKNKETMKDKEN
jgi:hypothetical protein